jgi:hypothetical protein
MRGLHSANLPRASMLGPSVLHWLALPGQGPGPSSIVRVLQAETISLPAVHSQAEIRLSLPARLTRRKAAFGKVSTDPDAGPAVEILTRIGIP